jgi:hypothetical protein
MAYEQPDQQQEAPAVEGESKAPNGLTTRGSMGDFKRAYAAKRKLLEREQEDFRFALGEQWSAEDKAKLEEAGFKPFTDNRIQPNLFLLTGLERQNRTDFKAFPEGDEDSLKADIATALFKHANKKSGFQYKSSDQFKDGITCGESHLELYLDYTENLINGKPCWNKVDGSMLFPDPEFREYDFSDARFVFKVTLDLSLEDLVRLYPEKEQVLRSGRGGRLNFDELKGAGGEHLQRRDYAKTGQGDAGQAPSDESCYDLLERYYKKDVERFFIGDRQTGEIKKAEDQGKADGFVQQYKDGIAQDQQAYAEHVAQMVAARTPVVLHPETGVPMAQPGAAEQIHANLHATGQLPPPPPERDPERFFVIKRNVPEIWCFAQVPGIEEPMADEPAWSWPKWKGYPFAPYFGRFSTAPLKGDDRHLRIQGVVHGVKGAQERHNKAEMLMQRHLNSSANSGWLAAEGAWVDPDKVEKFGTQPGINLEYKADKGKPERIEPGTLSEGHAQISAESAEAIKAALGINADLLASQQGGTDSGRAIALRQRQGLLMVQELFDNLSRTRQIAGRLLLSQLGEIFDTETAMKVLGDAFLIQNFPPVMLTNPQTGEQEPMPDPKTGQPMRYDKDLAETAIAEVLSGELGEYDVSVGEAVASESQRMANAAELSDLASKMPIPPDVLVRHSQLPEATKNEILSSIKQAQAMAAAAAQARVPHAPAPRPGQPTVPAA